MLGRKSIHAQECFAGGFIGVDFGIDEDLSRNLPEEWRVFNKNYIPVFLTGHPDKTKIGAGLACGALWTVSKGIKKGDLVLSPDGAGFYRIGEVIGDYYYAPGQGAESLRVPPHRRKVNWFDTPIERAAMSEALRNSTGSIGTVGNVTDYHVEIERLMGAGPVRPSIIAGDPRTLKTRWPLLWRGIWKPSW